MPHEVMAHLWKLSEHATIEEGAAFVDGLSREEWAAFMEWADDLLTCPWREST